MFMGDNVLIWEMGDMEFVGMSFLMMLELMMIGDGEIGDVFGMNLQVMDMVFFDVNGGMKNIILGDDVMDKINFGLVGFLGLDVMVIELLNVYFDGILVCLLDYIVVNLIM